MDGHKSSQRGVSIGRELFDRETDVLSDRRPAPASKENGDASVT